MTENEAIEEFKRNIEMPFGSDISNEASEIVLQALDEIKQYRAIGTVTECREAMEKQKEKIPDVWGDGYADGEMVYDMYSCPNCGESYEIDCHRYAYCPKCGQKIDRSVLG